MPHLYFYLRRLILRQACPIGFRVAAVVVGVGVIFACCWAGLASAQAPPTASGPADVGFFEDADDVDDAEALDEDVPAIGFRIPQVQEQEAEVLAAFFRSLENGQWEKAFAQYPELLQSTAGRLGQVDQSGLYRPIDRLITERIDALPPAGRAAFRLYFDAQARNLLDQVKNHPQPGSVDQLRLAELLGKSYLPATSSAEAGQILGDLYFERGRYREAATCWERTLAMHPETAWGQDGELAMQTRLALAYINAGDRKRAGAIATGLAQRFPNGRFRLGGQPVNAAAFLQEQLDSNAQSGVAEAAPAEPQISSDLSAALPRSLPQPGSEPAWAFTVYSPANVKRLTISETDRHYRFAQMVPGVADPLPPIAVDETAVFGHTMGSVFCLDLATGKQRWETRRLSESIKARTASQRTAFFAAQLDRHDYRIALTPELVLVVDFDESNRQSSSTVLKAYDKQTGSPQWTSAATLPDRQPCGSPLFHDGHIYFTSRSKGNNAADLMLHQIDPGTGQAAWSIHIGDLDLRVSPYTVTTSAVQPVLSARGGMIYVLTNNGAMVAVDRAKAQLAWAHQLDPPATLNSDQPIWRSRMPEPGSMPDPTPGGIVIDGSTLVVKESLSRAFYVFDLDAGLEPVKHEAESVYAELAGVEGSSVVFLSNQMEVHDTDQPREEGVFGERQNQARLLSANNLGSPASNCLVHDQKLYLLAHGQLLEVPMDRPGVTARFTSPHLPEARGGRLIAAPGRLICITPHKLVAFPIPTQLPDQPE